ncbi:hypothetical protein Col01nite_14590 [Cellulomonas oligotrophica]|uniref:Heparan-alpha-glucosaminide N-acetyltransferase catalytic domain-containing protein n=1 Tax=Cellulomonas oligotrophica TaxID=931536 RepID=A0ABQ4D987_9CELL|nr:hypothetical protein Col01nite_14590 [Cellulomonas oligotrophica]
MTAPSAEPVAAAPPVRRRRDAVRDRLVGFGRPPRVVGLDIARGLAVIGMIGAHVGDVPELVWSDPSTWGGVVHGRSSLLFAVVAGVSLALLTRGVRDADADRVRTVRLQLLGRGAAIFVIGLLVELVSGPVAVILTLYGVLFVAAIPLVRWSQRRLLLVAAGLALLGPVTLALVQSVALGSGPGTDLVLMGVYPATVWLALMMLGMAVGRLDLRSPRVAAGLVGVGVVLAVVGFGAGSLASGLTGGGSSSSSSSSWSSSSSSTTTVPGDDVDLTGLECEVWDDEWVSCYPAGAMSEEGLVDEGSLGDEVEDTGPDVPALLASAATQALSVSPHSGGTPEVVGSAGFALAVLGLCLLVGRPLRWVLLPVAALGSMPLTAYSLHVVLVATLGETAVAQHPNLYWLLMAGALALAASVWAVLVGRGPLETLTARVSAAAAGVTPAPAPAPEGAPGPGPTAAP